MALNGKNFVIFENLMGYSGKKNDVILFPSILHKAQYNMIFFHGDIQNYPEKMSTNRSFKSFLKWNLIDTGYNLISRFSEENIYLNIFMIKADSMENEILSNYSNFVLSDEFGTPINLQNQSEVTSLPHLDLLISNSIKSLKNSYQLNFDENLPIIMAGFSKGCVCLNKICYELCRFQELQVGTKEFVQKFQHFMWLDSGHNGGKCALITDIELNEVNDHKRFIKREYDKMIELLNENYQMKFKAKIYFPDKDSNDVQTHFELLNCFDCSLIE